jgi:hypothetical protein
MSGQSPATVRLRHGAAWLHLDRLALARLGLREPSAFLKHETEIVVRRYQFRIDGKGRPNELDPGLVLTYLIANASGKVERLPVLRVQGQDSRIARCGLVQSSSLVVSDGFGQSFLKVAAHEYQRDASCK